MNRWKNYVLMAAGVAALTLVGAFTAKPLLAQIKAALVQNVDEPGRSPYSSASNFTNSSCSGVLCVIRFTPVPAGKRLVVTNLTGQINVGAPGVVSFLILDAPASALSTHSTALIPTTLLAGTVNGSNRLGVTATLLAFFSAGDEPAASVLATTGISQEGLLTLSGYLVDCTSSSCAALVH